MNRTLLVICCVLLLSLIAFPLWLLQAQPKVEQRLDKLDNFIGELKAERDERKAEEARIQAELDKKKAEETKRLQAEADKEKADKAEEEKQKQLAELEEARKIVEEAKRIQAEKADLAKKAEETKRLQVEAEKKRLDSLKKAQIDAENKKVADKKAADIELIKTLQAELLKVKKELEEAKKATEIVPTQPPKKVGPPKITESRSFDKQANVIPTQPQPNPKTSQVRLENETDEIAKVKINDSVVEVDARKIKFVTVPSGQFTYQVLGVHEKPVLSELNEGQIYGLAIRNAPKAVKQDKVDKGKEELPKLPPDDVEIPQKTTGGSVRLINSNNMTIPFSINGKTYRVEPGQEILVKVPVGRCSVGLTGMTSQTWGYDIVEGTALRLGCSFSQAPTQGYYYPMQGYYPSCGFR